MVNLLGNVIDEWECIENSILSMVNVWEEIIMKLGDFVELIYVIRSQIKFPHDSESHTNDNKD